MKNPETRYGSNKTRRHILSLILVLFSCSSGFATWSIIMIDSKTNEIGIAGASCTHNCFGIGEIIPGMGAIIVQAMSNNEAREKGVTMIVAASSPEQIIQALMDPEFDPERQQYAVVTIKYINESATYTGGSTYSYKGALVGNGVSVQGNTLADSNVLKMAMQAVINGRSNSMHIAEVLMVALEEGSKWGGDRRCGEQRATSAFLTVAKPDDRKPYLELVIFGQKKGGQNAVDLLRKKFTLWKRNHQDAIPMR